MKQKKLLRWILVCLLALLITGAALVYQSINGPTKPKKAELWLSDNQAYTFRLPRSHGGDGDCWIKLLVPDTLVTGDCYYRLFPTNEMWSELRLKRIQDTLVVALPHQPPAGKLEYHFVFRHKGKVIGMPTGEPVVIRFRGDVPAGIIIPHASLMFIAMLLSNLALLLALFNMKSYRIFGIITTVSLFVGGLIFGPLVQEHAFGQYWTGFPFGLDLTDNKTLIAFVCWIIAVIANLRKERRYLTVLAGVVMLIIFTIPHSVKGSELDPESGEIKTGWIMKAPERTLS